MSPTLTEPEKRVSSCALTERIASPERATPSAM